MNLPGNFWNNVLDMDITWNEEGKIWFIGHRLGYIFCADVDKKEINIICKVSGISELEFGKYQQIIKYKNKLLCLPNLGKDILLYDIENYKQKNLIIKNCDEYTEMACTFAGIVQDNLYIVMGWNVRKILVLNMAEEKIVRILDIKCSEADDLIGVKSIINGTKIYMPIRNKEKIISFDIETSEFKEHFVPGNICGCSLLCQDKKNCWIIGRNYGIIRWNLDTDEFDEVENIPMEFEVFSVDEMGKMLDWYSYTKKRTYDPLSNNLFCGEAFCDKNYLYILPYFSDSILQINTDTMQIRLFQVQGDHQERNYQDYKGMPAFSSWGCDLDGKLRIVSRQDYKIYSIDSKTMLDEIENWDLSKGAINQLLNDLLDRKIFERKRVRLETLIYGVEKGYIKGKNINLNKSIGAKIYNKL